jgi:alpha-mannosidase
LLPHAAGLDAVRRAAYGLTRPLLWRREPAHRGALSKEFSAAHALEPGVLVETVKWAEDEEALILRLYEADGGGRTAQLKPGFPGVNAVDEVNLLEQHPRRVLLAADGLATLSLRAHEVKTLRLTY